MNDMKKLSQDAKIMLVDIAVNNAIAYIQSKLEITQGDNAGIFFSDHEETITKEFLDYIEFEEKMKIRGEM